MKAAQVGSGGPALQVVNENIGEFRVPNNLVGSVRRARIHYLRKCLLHSREQDQKLRRTIQELLFGYAKQRATPINDVNHSPGKRKEGNVFPLETEGIKTADRYSIVSRLEAGDHHTGVQIDDLCVARVDDAEFKGIPLVQFCDHRGTAEQDIGHGPRETRKDKPGNHSQTEKTDHGFQGHQDICWHAHRHGVAIADGRRSVNAEEKRSQKTRSYADIHCAEKRARTGGDKASGKERIERAVSDGYKGEKSRPRRGDKVRVAKKSLRSAASPLNVEASVAIEQAKIALLGENPTKSKIAIQVLRRGGTGGSPSCSFCRIDDGIVHRIFDRFVFHRTIFSNRAFASVFLFPPGGQPEEACVVIGRKIPAADHPPNAVKGSVLTPWKQIEEQQMDPRLPCLLVTQPAHAVLAGDLAQGILPWSFGETPLEIKRAISMHDTGWAALDAHQMQRLLSPGAERFRPISFVQASPGESAEAWTASIVSMERLLPCGALVVSRHFTLLALGHEKEQERFIAAERARQRRLAASARTEDVERWTALLGFCDLLSLYLISGLREEATFSLAHPASADAGAAPRVRLQFENDGMLWTPRIFPAGFRVSLEAVRHPGPPGARGERLQWEAI